MRIKTQSGGFVTGCKVNFSAETKRAADDSAALCENYFLSSAHGPTTMRYNCIGNAPLASVKLNGIAAGLVV